MALSTHPPHGHWTRRKSSTGHPPHLKDKVSKSKQGGGEITRTAQATPHHGRRTEGVGDGKKVGLNPRLPRLVRPALRVIGDGIAWDRLASC